MATVAWIQQIVFASEEDRRRACFLTGPYFRCTAPAVSEGGTCAEGSQQSFSNLDDRKTSWDRRAFAKFA